MAFVSSWAPQFGPAGLLVKAIAASLIGMALLLLFIVIRRALHARYFARRDRLVFLTRQHWQEIAQNKIRVKLWVRDPLAREVLLSMLLDNIEVAQGEDLPRLVEVLRRSGLLDKCIDDARTAQGWHRRSALVILGRTRAVEAIPALVEGLDDPDLETRIAAVRGLGRMAIPDAALPVLARFRDDQLEVPAQVLKNALLSCCRHDPSVVLNALSTVYGQKRELLARVAAELSSLSSEDDLLILAADASPEVRACAARGLAQADPDFALAPLSQLAEDSEWFVRLRAVVALGALGRPETIPVLVKTLCDRNRLVRQRAAWALMQLPSFLPRIVRQVVARGDNYGLQAFVAELERSGKYESTLQALDRSAEPRASSLLVALEDARERLSLNPPGEARPEEAIVR